MLLGRDYLVAGTGGASLTTKAQQAGISATVVCSTAPPWHTDRINVPKKSPQTSGWVLERTLVDGDPSDIARFLCHVGLPRELGVQPLHESLPPILTLGARHPDRRTVCPEGHTRRALGSSAR